MSDHPKVDADSLVIGAPSWAGPQPLLAVDHVEMTFRLLPLLVGQIEPIDILARGLKLNLVRRSPDQQSWSFSKGGAPHLGMVRSLVLDGGVFSLSDYASQIFLTESFDQKIGGGASSAFIVNAHGGVKGGEVQVRLNGGSLQRKDTDSYPMFAEIVDGATVVDLKGWTTTPLDFQHFMFAVHARGPNLADLKYLFSLLGMNSRSYDLKANAKRDGPLLDLTDLSGRIGDSTISGSSHSDRSGVRPRLKLQLASTVVTLSDLQTFLAPAPLHRAARIQPGASAPRNPAGPISPKDFDLARLRASDFDAEIKIEQVTGMKPAMHDLRARIISQNGVIVADPMIFNLVPGLGRLSLTFDVRSPTPKLALRASLIGTQLATLKGRQHAPIDGAADFWLNVTGEGRSPAAIAASSTGRAAFRIAAGHLPKVQAGILGGDALQALNGVFNKTASSAPLRCVVGEFSGAKGEFVVHQLVLAVGDGVATGAGTVDLKSQIYRLQLEPVAKTVGLFRFDLPVQITGPLNRPKAAIDVKKDGGLALMNGLVNGAAAPVLTAAGVRKTVRPAIDCDRLLTEAAAYTGPGPH